MSELRQKMAVFFAALIVVSTVAPALAAGAVGATSSSPSGMVGLADDQVTANIPQHAQDRIPSSANAWAPASSAHTSTMSMEVTTESARKGLRPSQIDTSTDDVVLEWTDDKNHEARTVAVDASTLVETVGYRPTMAYGIHESGDRWSTPITYKDGMATWTIPKFSTNSVSFDGNFSLKASPGADGDQYTWNTSDGGENLVVNATGNTNTEWDNESASYVGPSSAQSISLAGDNVTGPNGAPQLEISVARKFDNIDDNGDGGENYAHKFIGDSGVDSPFKSELKFVPKENRTLDEVSMNVRDYNSDYGTKVDVYLVAENPDKTYSEGTLIKDNWDPSWSGTVSFKLDNPQKIKGGQNYTLEFITLSSDNDGTQDSLKLYKDDSASGLWFTQDGNGKSQIPDMWFGGPTKNLKVSDGAGHSKTIGNISAGTTKTVSWDQLSASSTELNWTGSGEQFDYTLKAKEVTVSKNPVVELNNNSAGYTGTLADGETVTLTTNDSYLVAGENVLNLTVGDGTLSADAPTPQVDLSVKHDVVTSKSVDFKSETFAERYGVNKTWAEGGKDAKFTVSWASDRVVRVDDVKVKYYNSSDALDHVDKNPTYTAENGSLTVQLGDIPDGWTTRVIANGSKVQVKNGNITVLEPTKSGNTLNTKIRIDSKSDGFAIAVGGTASGNLIHHLEDTSYTGAEEYTVVDASGNQHLRAPKASSGATAYVRTIPVSASPEAGEVHISVTDTTSATEPQFTIVGPGNGNSVKYTFVEAKHDQAYILYSKSNDVVRDSGTANSPITLLDDDSLETLAFLEDDDGDGSTDSSSDGGSGGGGSSGVGARTSGGLSQTALLVALGLMLAGVWWLSQTYGNGNVSARMLLVAEAVVLGPIAFEVLTAASVAGGIASGVEALLSSIGAGLGKAMPLVVLVVAALGYLYLRNKGKPSKVNKIIFRGGK